jgi:hypothetical protein
MDCPQCGAEVPSDDAFCGKCGYARRDQGPERLDHSRIRVHEEPEPQPDRASSQHRIRKHTVLGMASAAVTPPAGSPTPPSVPPPPTSIASARSARTRTPQKTMLGIPRPDLPDPASATPTAGPADAERSTPAASESAPPEAVTPSHRTRARVRYDSANESLPVIQRRQKALRGLAVLVLVAAAWLGYRFLTVNG